MGNDMGTRSVHARLGALAGIGTSAMLLAGCCDDGRREMERVAKEYGDAAHACCQQMLAVDPAGAAACFEDVKNWRLETGALIIAWYQACLNGNRSLANEVLGILTQEVKDRASQACGGIVTLADGRVATVGIPFGPEDRISLAGRLVSPFGLVVPPQFEVGGDAGDRAFELRLDGGTFAMHAFGADVNGALLGSMTLVPSGPAEYLVTAASIRFGVGSSELAFDLDDDHGHSRLRLDGQRGTLRLVMATELSEGLSLLVPPRVALDLPLRVGGGAIELDANALPALAVMPGALGFADWNGDGAVTTDDWVAFFQTQPVAGVDPRDLDLDGDYDADDIRAFVTSWRERMSAP